MKNIIHRVVMFVTLMLGFFGALAVVRLESATFNLHAGQVYGDWFFAQQWRNLLWLFGCIGLFANSVWYMKPTKTSRWFIRKIDYLYLLMVCLVGIHVVFLSLTTGFNRLWFFVFIQISLDFTVIILPILAYLFAMLAFGEIIARLRDKTLLQTLYWIYFFKAYPIIQPIGFIFALLLASQFLLMLSVISAFGTITFVRPFAIATMGLLTCVAVRMINLVKIYDKANAEKIRAERFKSELITNVSHDIKTPLTSIINYVDLLKNEGLQGQAAEHLQVLDRKSARLKVLIDDLMEASKAGTGNLKVEMKEIDLSEIVGQVSGEFEDNFADKGLILVLRQPEAPVYFNTDSRHLYRVLENLLSNATKYALAGTRVFVEIALRDNGPHITIQNTSASPIELSDGEATEQFMRGDKSRQTEGSGLGLYIAKSLVELIGGKLLINISGDLFRVDIFM